MSTNLFHLLRVRYPSQSYAIFREVQSATAYQGKQRADAVAMGLWPSRGLDVIGFEFKSSRSDWLRELKQPDKAEQIFQFCDRWYLVVGSGSIVHGGELPPTWGLLVADGDKLHEQVAAPKLDAKPMAREFLASLLRSAQKVAEKAESAPREELRAEILREVSERHRQEIERIQSREDLALASLAEKVKKFEAAAGVSIAYDWKFPEGGVGAALALVAKNRAGMLGTVESARNELAAALKDAEAAIKALSAWDSNLSAVSQEPTP